MKPLLPTLAVLLSLAACERPAQPLQPPAPPAAPAQPAPPAPPAAPAAPVEPVPPGQPGGLPDDRTPISEAPFTPTSPNGAADVVQTYYALIGEGQYDKAWLLWSGQGEASGLTQPAFAASFLAFTQYNAQVGAPGQMEGAAGSSYIEIPVQVYGRQKNGQPFHKLGSVTLRRVNDVPGSTAEQRLWRIYRINLN